MQNTLQNGIPAGIEYRKDTEKNETNLVYTAYKKRVKEMLFNGRPSETCKDIQYCQGTDDSCDGMIRLF